MKPFRLEQRQFNLELDPLMDDRDDYDHLHYVGLVLHDTILPIYNSVTKNQFRY